MKDIFVVTHTQSQHHVDGLVGGWHDTPLTEKGSADAQRIAAHLRAVAGDAAQPEIFTSDLMRATQTAQAIADAFASCEPLAMPDLREISYGEAEGKPQRWLDERLTPAPDDNRLDHRYDIAGAETRREFATRIYRAMDGIIARPAELQVIVTHGFALTFVVAAWIGMPLEAAGFVNFTVPSGSVTHLRQDDYWRNRAVISLGDESFFALGDSAARSRPPSA
ncbi:histidine phosphatase family protein [Hyphomicrobium sulfonivorans]|uniref:histidine phosphatase family protein n=1 Tax=Hyphomicrobium sulfonivorans TaxID=121290 RepID=UPI001570E609|nr:histidine phosphatase family protein [Hyphomicrobium sulfonivorans]MBI1649044.1 histidine phosphatase family protein [Hyphomicrobium sulfonivorans]NSL70422.1 histidine phosphatase family protein [Hyphomicrobium sulfonivorans]